MWRRQVPVKDQSNDVSMEVNTSLAEQFAKMTLHDKDEIIKTNEKSPSKEIMQVGEKPNMTESKWHKDAFNMSGRKKQKRPPWYLVSPFERPPLNVTNEVGQGEPCDKIMNIFRNFSNKPSSMQINNMNRNFLGRYFRRQMHILHQKEARDIIFCSQRGLMVDWNERLQVETNNILCSERRNGGLE